jgi:hypothetical protein
MRRLSRWMAPAGGAGDAVSHPVLIVSLAMLGVAVLSALLLSETARYLLSAFAIAAVVGRIRELRWRRRVARERQGESICSFAGAFERRTVDPRAIRAVHEALTSLVSFRGGAVPIRATDRMTDTIGLPGEDLEELAEEIAERVGRRTVWSEQDPFLGSVATAGDLVHFISAQPYAAEHCP